MRLGFGAVTVLMFWPGYLTNVTGFGLFVVLALIQKLGNRTQTAPA